MCGPWTNHLQPAKRPRGSSDHWRDELRGDHRGTAEFSQQKNPYQARFIFNKRNRLQGEPFKTFNSIIKKLSTDCEFGQNLEERLVERVICGVNNEKSQGDSSAKRILSWTDFS